MVTTAVRPKTAGEILRTTVSVGAAGLIKIMPHILLGIGLAFGWVYTLLMVPTGSGTPNLKAVRGLDIQGLLAYGKTALLISIPFFIVGLIITCGIWGRIASVLTGREMSVGESLRLGASRWWSYFWANVVVFLAMFMGSVFLALFGGVLSVAMTLVLTFLMILFGSSYHAAVVLEGNGPFSGVRRCFDLVLPYMGHAAVSFLLVFLVGFGLSFAAQLTGSISAVTGGGGTVTGLIQAVVQVAVSVLFLAAAIVVHSDLAVRSAPPETDGDLEPSPV